MKSSVAVACFLPVCAKDLSAPLYLLQTTHEVVICATQYFTRELFRNSRHFVLQHAASCCDIELIEVGPQEMMLGIDVRRSWRPALSTADALWKSVMQDRAANVHHAECPRRYPLYVGLYHDAERILSKFPAPWI